ncbi:hypothetical protein [Geminicoccus roseus]|uniref:hypothetical protein n=1 Tax=Geminicoccus roseus TaxID=404900 RepID=UPI0012F8B8F4|nr:hypothetical protein [Geminicoccus roseus]
MHFKQKKVAYNPREIEVDRKYPNDLSPMRWMTHSIPSRMQMNTEEDCISERGLHVGIRSESVNQQPKKPFFALEREATAVPLKAPVDRVGQHVHTEPRSEAPSKSVPSSNSPGDDLAELSNMNFKPFDQAVALMLCARGCSIDAVAGFQQCSPVTIERLCEIAEVTPANEITDIMDIVNNLEQADHFSLYFLRHRYGSTKAKRTCSRARSKVKNIMNLVNSSRINNIKWTV